MSPSVMLYDYTGLDTHKRGGPKVRPGALFVHRLGLPMYNSAAQLNSIFA